MTHVPARPTTPRWRALAAFALATFAFAPWLAAAPAFAQSSPPLATMPLPPSASDPAPVEGKSKTTRRKPAAKASTTTTGEEPRVRSRRSSSAEPSSTSSSYDRPTRYVPEEFDRGGGESESRAKPFMNESGRAGMGMRF